MQWPWRGGAFRTARIEVIGTDHPDDDRRYERERAAGACEHEPRADGLSG